MRRPRFAVRTIRNGAVRVFGARFRPEEPCTLRGRFVFGTELLDAGRLYLWGTERLFRARTDAEQAAAYREYWVAMGPHRWEWWYRERAERHAEGGR